MKYRLFGVLLAILLTFTMVNASFAWVFATPQPASELPSTEPQKPAVPDPKKLDEEAATVTALKHCLAMDGSLNQQPRLIDAYNTQPDLDHLPQNLSDAEKEKVMLYTMGRPDIPDFGFLIPGIWRVTPRDARIKFDAVMALKLSEVLSFKYGTTAAAGNCKPVMQGDITTSGNFEHARISMPLAFGDKEVRLTYLLSKQSGYNWQIEDLLIDNAGVANYVKKDLGWNINTNGLITTINKICISLNLKDLTCQSTSEDVPL